MYELQNVLNQSNEPLFPNILWEQPINKKTGKKLLIVGGHKNKFIQTQKCYQAALSAGIGDAKVLLPDSLKKIVQTNQDCLLAPSTPSGSFAKNGYEQIMAMIDDCDGVLFAGELSTNSETLDLFKNILKTCQKSAILTTEVIATFSKIPDLLTQNSQRLLISTMSIFKNLDIETKLKTNDLKDKILLIQELYRNHPASYVAIENNAILVTSQNQISVTPLNATININLENSTATFGTSWLQHNLSFEALTSAAYKLISQPK
jgi:hypothetical protein